MHHGSSKGVGSTPVTSTREEGAQETSTLTGRPNIDDINKRNAEEERQDKKSSYIVIGIMVLVLVAVIVLVYFFT